MRFGSQLCGSCLAAIVFAMAAPLAMAADTYKVDPVHSSVVFRIKHLDVSYSYGRFNNPTGTVVWDAADPTKSSVNVEIKTENVDTDNQKRDDHLRGPDFFDVKQFPTITFKSTAVKAVGENKFDVTGNLTLHGVTKSITISLGKTGEAQTQMGYRAGWETAFKIKRSDYGMTGMVGPVGDEVELYVSIEGGKQ